MSPHSLHLRKKLEDSVSSYIQLATSPINGRLLKVYKWFISVLIFKLRLIPQTKKVVTFWGEDIKMIGVRPFSLYLSGYIGNDDLFITYYIIDILKEGNIFLDVGANIGFFTMLASKIVGSEGKVFAFEPTPYTYKYLKKNVNNKINVNTYRIAVHDKCGLQSLTDFGPYNNFYNSLGNKDRLVAQLTDLQKENHSNLLEVPTVTIDSFCFENNILPNLIKLDTEDTEDIILSASMNIIEKSKPDIIFEMFHLSVLDGRLQNIINVFSRLDYNCYQFCKDGFKLIEKDSDASPNYYNYLLSTRDPNNLPR
ncbi:MAG: FkbM family methyltransferase [bacterium]